MTIAEKIEQQASKLIDNAFVQIEKYNNKITDKLDTLDSSNITKETTTEKIATDYYNTVTDVADSYCELLEPYFDLARKTTVPINWPYFLYLKIKNKFNTNILFHPGVHFFVALQGGGKSTLAYDLISEILRNTGKSAYINAMFEVPRHDPISNQYFTYFQYFKLLDFFNMTAKDDNPEIEVSQLKQFNRNFDTIVLDEWLTEMNHRLNKTKDYNNIFMAMIEMIAHMRHQKMNRIYVLSQIDNTDIQLLSMFKYIHEIEIDLDITYKDWVASGKLTKHIKGWHVYTFGVKRNRKKQSTEKVLLKKQYRKATADFDYFDTLSQSHKYKVLPEDKINFIK